jgi:hypothetical protein
MVCGGGLWLQMSIFISITSNNKPLTLVDNILVGHLEEHRNIVHQQVVDYSKVETFYLIIIIK